MAATAWMNADQFYNVVVADQDALKQSAEGSLGSIFANATKVGVDIFFFYSGFEVAGDLFKAANATADFRAILDAASSIYGKRPR